MEDFSLNFVLNFLATLVCFATAIKMYFVIKKNPENIKIRYFFYSFIFITIYLFVNGLSFLMVKNPLAISVINSLSLLFLLIGGMFLCLTALNFTKFKKYEKAYIYTLLFIVLLNSVLAFLGLRDTVWSSYQGIEYWARPENYLIVSGMLISGIFFMLSLLFSTIFYFQFALRQKRKNLAFGKSLMIAEGCFFFFLAVFFHYVIGTSPGNFLITSTVASIFFMTGAISFISSVVYQGVKKKK